MYSKTYFISGHTNTTQDEYNQHYRSKVSLAIKSGGNFIVGDARGADYFARLQLKNLGDRVTVYHVGDAPRGLMGENFKKQGGFQQSDDRDAAMTAASDEDILWMRPPEEYKKILGNRYNPMHISNTMQNFLRRQEKS